MTFVSLTDREVERKVADMIEARCEGLTAHLYDDDTSEVDIWCERWGNVRGYVDVKRRDCLSTDRPGVFLKSRKWVCLQDWARLDHGPVLLVWVFRDVVKFIDVRDIEPGPPVIMRRGTVRAKNDVEPGFDVPVASMHTLGALT